MADRNDGSIAPRRSLSGPILPRPSGDGGGGCKAEEAKAAASARRKRSRLPVRQPGEEGRAEAAQTAQKSVEKTTRSRRGDLRGSRLPSRPGSRLSPADDEAGTGTERAERQIGQTRPKATPGVVPATGAGAASSRPRPPPRSGARRRRRPSPGVLAARGCAWSRSTPGR